jgi:hypothetical protein
LRYCLGFLFSGGTYLAEHCQLNCSIRATERRSARPNAFVEQAQKQRRRKMAHTNQEVFSEATLADVSETTHMPDNVDKGTQLHQRAFLDELPGAAFAAMTLVWIFASFNKLTW